MRFVNSLSSFLFAYFLNDDGKETVGKNHSLVFWRRYFNGMQSVGTKLNNDVN